MDDDPPDIEMIMTYRRVFNTPDGKVVLEDILSLLGLNESIESEAQGALHNAAVAILARAGILRPWNSSAIVSALLSLPYSPGSRPDKE